MGIKLNTIAIFSVFLYAQLGLAQQSFEEAYKPYWKVKKEIRHFYQLQQEATFPIRFDSGPPCSAVFVGPRGQALTNLHCIEECLVQNQAVESQGLKILVLPKKTVNCGVRYGKKMTSVTAKVLKVMGPGWLDHRDELGVLFESNLEGFLDFLDQGFESYGDLVLVQLPLGQTTCVRIANSDKNQTDTAPAFSIAYPILNRPTDNPFEPLTSFGLTQMWSFGQILNSADKIKKWVSKYEQFVPIAPLVSVEGMTLSSIDGEGGSSGSPVFNPRGELISLSRSVFKGDITDYIPWTTQGIDLTLIKQDLESKINDTELCGVAK